MDSPLADSADPDVFIHQRTPRPVQAALACSHVVLYVFLRPFIKASVTLATTAPPKAPGPLLVPGKGGEGLSSPAVAVQEHGRVPWAPEKQQLQVLIRVP